MKKKDRSQEKSKAEARPKQDKLQTYRVDLRRKAQFALDKLPEDDLDAILREIKDRAKSPRPKGGEKIKAASLWRIRVGDYRIIYSVDDKQKLVVVVRIGHRREVYRSS